MRFAEGHPFYVLELLRRLFGCLLVVFGPPLVCSWGAFGSIGLPLDVSCVSLGPFWRFLGSFWGASWRSLGSLEVDLGPRSSKDFQNGAPGYQNHEFQLKSKAHSLNKSTGFFFKVVPCNAFRKGKPKQSL